MEKKLKQIISTTVKKYPKDEDIWVEIYTDVPMGVASKISGLEQVEAGFEMIVSMVKDWNFADSDGKELSIDKAGVEKLPVNITEWLISIINGEMVEDTEEKKS